MNPETIKLAGDIHREMDKTRQLLQGPAFKDGKLDADRARIILSLVCHGLITRIEARKELGFEPSQALAEASGLLDRFSKDFETR